MRLGLEGRRRLRAGGRRPASALRAAGGLPERRSHRARADHRRQPATASARPTSRSRSNTIQFGARAQLYAAALGFSIEGDVGFDVLIQLVPFHFLADFHASVQLKRGSRNLFKVTVEGALEGAAAAAGRAARRRSRSSGATSRSRFDATLVGGGRPPNDQPVDVLGELRGALGEPRAWQAQLPPGAAGERAACARRRGRGVLLHPLGSLTVRQSVVPLNLDARHRPCRRRVAERAPGASRSPAPARHAATSTRAACASCSRRPSSST